MEGFTRLLTLNFSFVVDQRDFRVCIKTNFGFGSLEMRINCWFSWEQKVELTGQVFSFIDCPSAEGFDDLRRFRRQSYY